MKKILTAAEMKACDTETIERFGVPGLVLMERAALCVCRVISEDFKDTKKVGVFCGPGNNGGDGVAIARILHTRGVSVKVIMLGDSKRFSASLRKELEIAGNYGTEIIYPWNIDDISVKELSKQFGDCDLFVDAMFGIGLTRGLEGEFAVAARFINESGKSVVAVDMPSGFDTDSGKLLGEAGVSASTTVTFAYMKKGLVLGECKVASGNVKVEDVGIYTRKEDVAELIDKTILEGISKRSVTANKGNCGKVLVIAGSEEIYGACYLAAKAALVSGAGLVKVYTHENNISSIQQNLPEAMYKGYKSYDEDGLKAQLAWADAVVVGPGLAVSDDSIKIMETVARQIEVPVIIDADGLNLLSKEIDLLDKIGERVPVILTPHLKEMERLCGQQLKEINYTMADTAKKFASKHNCIVVLKNHTEVICDSRKEYYCCSGNEALATPGSGDVLAGIIGALLGQKYDAMFAAKAGAYVHGAAGTIASASVGIKGLLAGDIISQISQLLD